MTQLRVLRSVACIAGLTAMALVPERAAAQSRGFDASAILGGRGFVRSFDTTALAKLEEYRDLRSGPVLLRFDLRWLPNDHYGLWLGTTNSGQRDQGYWLRSSRVGRFDFQARLDETPHTYSTNAHVIGNADTLGIFALPTPRLDTATINASAITAPVRQRWDVARFNLKLDPTQHWDMRAQYTRTRKQGDRPMGMAFGSPGNNNREILEPIRQTVHDVSVTQEISVRRLQVQARYNLSAFENDISTVTAYNQLVTVDAAAAGSSRGRSALAPNNLAQSVTVTAALGLPQHTRLTTTASYGWRSQSHAFVPATINSKILNPQLSPDSMAANLAADVRTTLVQVAISSTPVRALSLAARYRSFDFEDRTPAIVIPAHVVNDRTLDTNDIDRENATFGRRNAGVDARLRIAPPISVSAGWDWDQWRRDTLLRSNIGRLTDNTVKTGINVQPLDWGVVRALYSRSWRRSATSYLDHDPATLPELRRFDLADRDRNRFDLIGQLTPIPEITLSGSYGRWHDAYNASAYGLRDDDSWAAGGEIAVSPIDRISLDGSYQREQSHLLQQSRSRQSPALLSNLTYDWVGNTIDIVDTYTAGFDAVVIPGKLSIGGSLQLSQGVLSIGGLNPNGAPTGGTATQNAQATATNFPDITYRLIPVSGFVRYDPLADWSAIVRFTYEKFENTDFRSDGLKPATGADIFLGNDLLPYGANILTVAIAYRLGMSSFGAAPGIRR